VTVHRSPGDITFECDGCDETLPIRDDGWDAAMAEFRDQGWKAEKVQDEWLHLCPDCRRHP
jgi:hypothetical protein